MPGEAQITLVRPDGSTIDASPEQAARLAVLGYKEMSPEQNAARLTAESRSDYYTAPDQKISAGLEGLTSGLSLGASDYLLGDEGLKARAAYNPGVRMGAETLGALLPLVMTDGASASLTGAETEASFATRALKATPTKLLADAAESLSFGAEGSLTKAVTRGAVEGGLFGGAQAADHAYLDGDPITAEAVLHGIGWGGVFGGVLGGAAHGLTSVGENMAAGLRAENERVAGLQERADAEAGQKTAFDKARFDRETRIAAETPKPVEVGTLNKVASDDFEALRNEVSTFSKSAKEVTKVADDLVDSVTSKLLSHAEEASGYGAIEQGKVVDDIIDTQTTYKKLTSAIEKGDIRQARFHASEYTYQVDNIGKALNVQVPGVSSAVDDLVAMRVTQRELAKFPRSVEEFATLSPGRVEQTIASLNQVGKTGIANSQAVTEAVGQFVKSLGLEAEHGLRPAWRSAKDLLSREGKSAAIPKTIRPARTFSAKQIVQEEAKKGSPGMVRQAVGYALGGKAYVAARMGGFGRGGAYAAYRGVRDAVTHGGGELMGIRAEVMGAVRSAAAEYLPKIGKFAKISTPRVEPLAVTLTGEIDKTTTDRQELAKNRAFEIAAAAPNIKDTLYKSLEPLSISQPQLTPALHKAALVAFQALYGMTPKDTGVLSGLKSIWKPSQLQAAVLSKQLSVFHDPIGEAVSMLKTGEFDPIKVMTLKEVAPSSWQELRLGVLTRITDPKINAKLTYREQVGLSTLLDLPVHSSVQPQQIAATQQLFVNRSKPLTATPRMGPAGGMPTPPSNNSNATSAQRSTER